MHSVSTPFLTFYKEQHHTTMRAANTATAHHLLQHLLQLLLIILLTPPCSLVAAISVGPRSGRTEGTTTTALQSVPGGLDTLTSGFASICRLPRGVTVQEGGGASDISKPLVKLYDVENDAECRMVRERITELDLCVDLVVPAAPNSRVFVDPGYEHYLGEGSVTVPRLVWTSPGGGEQVAEGAEAVLDCLEFGNGTAQVPDSEQEPAEQLKEAVAWAGNRLAGVLRAGRGKLVSASAIGSAVPRPSVPPVLYSYEGNQFCRLVREVLTELDIPYELRSAGKESPRRDELVSINANGSSQCPYLVDASCGVSMGESADIVEHLYKNYALWTPPNELLRAASDAVLPLVKPVYRFLTPLQAGSSEVDAAYLLNLKRASESIEEKVRSHPVVIYTFTLSPFSSEAKLLLDRLGIEYHEISLGKEWLPGLISDGDGGESGSLVRASLLDTTGQSSLPHIFVGGTSVGGLFSGTPGLIPGLEDGTLLPMVEQAKAGGQD